MSGVRTPSLRLSRTMTRTVPPSRRNARSCSSAHTCVLECHTSEPHRFARVAERQDKEPRAPVLAGLRMAHHRAVAVIDLAFFARRGGDHDARVGRDGAAQRHDEAPDTRIPRGEAVVVDEVLPDRHRVAARGRAPRRSALDTARTRSRSAHDPGVGPEPRSVDTSPWWPVLPARSRWTPPRKLPVLTPRSRWTPPAKWPVLVLIRGRRPRPRTAIPAAFR